MIHVSGCCNPAQHTTGSYYLNADTMVFMQVILSDLFKDFPTLKFIIPHGGGAVPFHWGRFRGIALNNAQAASLPSIMAQRTSSLTPASTISRASIFSPRWCRSTTSCSPRRWSARSRATIPRPGFGFDDTKRYVDASPLSAADKAKVFEGNAYKVYSRLKQQRSPSRRLRRLTRG